MVNSSGSLYSGFLGTFLPDQNSFIPCISVVEIPPMSRKRMFGIDHSEVIRHFPGRKVLRDSVYGIESLSWPWSWSMHLVSGIVLESLERVVDRNAIKRPNMVGRIMDGRIETKC